MSHEVARHPPRSLQRTVATSTIRLPQPRIFGYHHRQPLSLNYCGKSTSPYVALPAISIPSSLRSSVDRPGALSSALDLPHTVVTACLDNTAPPRTSNFLSMGRTLIVAHRKAKSKTSSHAPTHPASCPRRWCRWVWKRLVEVGQTTGGQEPGGSGTPQSRISGSSRIKC